MSSFFLSPGFWFIMGTLVGIAEALWVTRHRR